MKGTDDQKLRAVPDKPISDGAIFPAVAEDVTAIAGLLREADLPHEDFAAHVARFFVVRRKGEVIGAIGAQVDGPDALLRSLVVAPEFRGLGLGDALLKNLERAAAAWGVQRWWLLTTTAEAFFVKRGFRVVSRGEAPASVAATEEFRGLCPSVAVCLSRERRSVAP